MKEMNEVLKNKLQMSHAGLKSCKWSDIYDTEDELIKDMFNDKLVIDENAPVYKICRGYEYIRGFRKYFEKNHELIDKQLRQLKRLASEIAFHIYVG